MEHEKGGMDYYDSMLHSTRVLAWLALSLASLPALSQTPAAPAASAPAAGGAEAPLRSRLTARLMYELLLSELTFDEGNGQTGSAYMLNAARRTGEESLFRRATEMAIQSRSGPAAVEATRAWRQAHPDSADASRYELQVLIVLGRVAESESPLRAVLNSLPAADKVSFITALPALYQRVPDKNEAAQAIERGLAEALKTPALAPAAWTTIGRMRLQAGDQAGALSAATLGQDADAHSEWPALLALQLLAGAGEAQAEPLIRRHLASPAAKPEVQIGYARALAELGRPVDAHAQLSALTQRLPRYPDGWLVQGALYADERQDAQAEQALQRYLDLSREQADEPGADGGAGRNQAQLALARIAERPGDYATPEKLLAAVDSPDQMLTVQTRRANLLARQGRIEEARQAIQSVPEQQPEDARLKLLAEAQLLRDHGQAQLAYQLLSNELKRNPDDDGLLYDAAMAAERIDRMDEMERLLRRVIALKPNAAHAHNALGYSLADRGVRLTEAKTLIEKAVQLSPDDGYIQDSLGWVEFRLGRPREARRILEAAYKKRPDAEIAAHLGEVLWTLGEREAAHAMWREGLRLDPENDTLVKTLKRLQVAP